MFHSDGNISATASKCNLLCVYFSDQYYLSLSCRSAKDYVIEQLSR